MTRLTDHFTLAELTASEIAAGRRIDNTPSDAVIDNLRRVADKLEIVRNLLGGKPIVVSSGYRAPALNLAVGGSRTSAHLFGRAADFTCPGFGTPLEICRVLAQHAAELGFDQLIQEGTWVHLGLSDEKPRGQILTAHFGAGGTTYTQGLA